MRNCRGTCSSVEMQKGYMFICQNAEEYMVIERLGTPVVERVRVRDPWKFIDASLGRRILC